MPYCPSKVPKPWESLASSMGPGFAPHDTVAVEIPARRQPRVRRCDEAEGPVTAKPVADECAVMAGAVVEFVDEDDIRVHGTNDCGNLGNLRVGTVPQCRRKLSFGATAHRSVEGREANAVGAGMPGEGCHDESGEEEGREVHDVPATGSGL